MSHSYRVALFSWGKTIPVRPFSSLKKPAISALVFLMLFSSVAPAFAQETIDTTSVSNSETVVASPQASVDSQQQPVDPGQGNGKPKPGDGGSVTAQFSSGYEPSFPSFTESTHIFDRNIKVSESTGAFTYDYPLTIPPGRNGLQPEVKISYSNQASQEIGILGSDQWSVSIPFIERINRRGLENLYASDFYFSSLSGELATTATAGEFRAKSDGGEFIKYVLSSNVWTVTDKKGTVYKFGTTASSRQDNPNDTTKVYKWMLEEVRDTNDNFIKYEYFKDAGQIYPSKITYTGNGITNGIFEIEFLRQARTDTATSHRTGFAVTTSYRINEIQAKVSGTWVRKFTLAYTTADNTRTSLISSITESGQDESANVITLPATSFQYTTANTGGSGSGWATNNYGSPVSTRDGVEMVDINGDGYGDVVQAYQNESGQSTVATYINRGDGNFDLNANYALPAGLLIEKYSASAGGDIDYGTRFLELNGDGLTDVIWSVTGGAAPRSFLNNGNGWTETDTWDVPFALAPNDGYSASSYRNFIIDINGDGLSDIMKQSTPNVYVNTGNGWTTSYWGVPQYSDLNEGISVVELNGDGLPDLVQNYDNISNSYDDKRHAWLNDGRGNWVEVTNLIPPVPIIWFTSYDSTKRDYGTRFVDINGDGLTDVLVGQGSPNSIYRSFLNTGNGWSETSVWVPPFDFASASGLYDDAFRGFIADYRGDGLSGFFRSAGDSQYRHNAKKRADLIKKVTKPSGATTDIVYKPSAQYKNGTTLLNPKLPMVLDTVEQLTDTENVRNVVSTKTFVYENGLYYFGSTLNRKFAGFGKITQTDTAGNTTKTFYHQGNTTDSANGEYNDHVSKIGRPYRIEKANNVGSVYSKVINKWDHADLGQERSFVKLAQTINFSYDGDSDHRDTATTYTYENTYGNLTQKKDWGEVTGADAGTFTDVGTDTFTTDIQYALNAGAYIVGLPKQETVTDTAAAKVSETRYYYDLQALGSVTDGNETKREMWVTGTTYIDTEKTYNTTYGIVTQEKDPRDKATNYVYEANNLYPATVTNPLNQQTQYTYDYSSGKVTQMTDPNTRVFQTIYDALDRVKEEKQPDKVTPATLVTKALYAYNDTASPRSVTQTAYLDATLTNDSVTYLDGFDRAIQTRTRAEAVNTYAAKDVLYDSLGHIQKESLPYFSTGTAYTTPTTNTSLLTTYTYDALDRVLTAVSVVGTTSHAYDQWKETVTDAKGKIKDFTQDAYGNLVKVEERNGASTYTTTYAYNGLQKLTALTDASGNVRNFTYDGLGRRLTAQDLHATADATYGTWTYTYDAAGNMTQQLDPKSQTVNYTYDDLNRVATEDYTGQTGTEVTYAYDTCTEGKGRLCSVTATANTAYTYYATGETKTEQKTIDGNNYTTTYSYDRQGNATNIIYPDNSEVKYTYNAGNQIETVQKKDAGGSFTNVVVDFDYAPTGQITYQENANNTATTNTYDANELYRLRNKKTEYLGTFGMGQAAESEQTALLASRETGSGVVPQAPPSPGNQLEYRVVVIEDENGISEPSSQSLTAQGLAYEKADGSIELYQPLELTKERTEKSKTYLTGYDPQGKEKRSAKLHTKGIHYRNQATGQLDDIDTTLTLAEGKWNVDKVPYKASVPENLQNEILTFTNRRQQLTFALVNPSATPKAAVVSNTTDTNRKVTYPDALGKGKHIEVVFDTDAVTKDVVIESKASLGNLNKITNYEIPFKLTSNLVLTVETEDGTVLVKGTPVTTDKAVKLTDRYGITSYLWPARVIGTGDKRPTQISVRYELKDDGLYLTKLIPTAWLMKAAYPVRADVTVSYYAGAGDGAVYNSNASWATAQGAAAGSSASYNNVTYHYVSVGKNGSSYAIERGFFPIDTTALPTNATISSAVFKVYSEWKTNGDNDGEDFLTVVQGFQPSTSALTTADYDLCGNTIDNPIEGINTSERKDISNIAIDQYISFNLNATGISWIVKGGWTKLCMREGHDVLDHAYAGSNNTYNEIEFNSQYSTGTAQDPYLEVTYTTGGTNSAPTAPTSLLTEGLTNPTNIADTTPEFSALYNDPDAGDIAIYYQVQVSATQGVWTSPVWDSAKTGMAATTQGQRSPDISYAGSALNPGTTYYWRIKFWDDEDAQGAWSTETASFSIASPPPPPPPGCATSTVTFYPTAGDGSVYHETSSWSTVQGASAGIDASYTPTIMYIGPGRNASTYAIERPFFPFDTRSLPDTATIQSAKLGVYPTYKENGDNDGEDWFTVVQTFQGSTTTLVVGDYDLNGNAIDNPTEGVDISQRKDITSVTTGQYLVFNLNSTGLSWINKSGDTKLGLREGHDVLDHAYAGAANTFNELLIRSSEYTGTANDPYLEVTYQDGTCSGGSQNIDLIQDLTYTYDAVGNITQIVDVSGTATAKTTAFGYDDLHRLTSATATNATSTSPGNYTHTYAYDAIGNITSMTGVGTYLYQGTNYANPHAATSINGVTQTYDNNGNLTNDGTWTQAWNYRNELTQSSGGSTVTYAYDHTGQRVKLVSGGTTTRYANKLYNTDGTKNTKHIYARDLLIATLENTALYYDHTDHLTGSSALTDSNAAMVQLLDYYPYGAMRIDQTTTFDEQRKNFGHEFDRATNLTYANARYYKQNIGRFISRDTWEGKLDDPQSLNTYAYSRNNPVKYFDPGGNQFIIPDPITGRPMQPNLTPSQQNLDRLVQSVIPVYGDLQDISEVRTGQDFFTGQQLSGGEKLLTKIGLFIPLVVSGRALRAGANFISNLFSKGDDVAKGIEAARRSAVREAWRMEKEIISNGGEGRRAWTEAEKKELLETGRVRGYEGHHINSVADNPDLAGNPNNIDFVQGRAEHLDRHGGDFRNPTSGPLIDQKRGN